MYYLICDRHHAIADYLLSQGFSETLESFKKEAKMVKCLMSGYGACSMYLYSCGQHQEISVPVLWQSGLLQPSHVAPRGWEREGTD